MTSPRHGRLDRLSAAPGALFVYGTLRFPEIWDALIGRAPDRSPAVAEGWRAAALPGLIYPGLVPHPEGSAAGLFVSGLTAGEWRVVDIFENDLYELRRLRLADGRRAWAYVCAPTVEVCPHDWSADEFADRHLAAYVPQCIAWRRSRP
ncbi:MAG: gamma-glutamylcyclotransferase [Streptosporangiales bacterium]|nr:gamma-glutamylcyclotransferase [Streptosporangiales bacterium]